MTLTVRDVMTTPVFSVTTSTPLKDVARLLVDHRISGVPVVDDERHVVGIVTELDLIVRNTRLVMPHFIEVLDWGKIPLERPRHMRERLQHMLGTEVRDVMTEKVITIGPDASIEELAELMVQQRVNPVPVVDAAECLIGIVSRADLIDMMAAQLA